MAQSRPETPASTRPDLSSTSSRAASSNSDRPSDNLLFRLPRELRDKIYTFALVSSQPHWWPSQHSSHNLAPALLRTCRTIYHETAPILYSGNSLMFAHPSDCNMFRHIMDSTYAQRLTSICLRIRDKDVRLWTSYLGSTTLHRSLTHDYPSLKILWIFFRSNFFTPPPPPIPHPHLPPNHPIQLHWQHHLAHHHAPNPAHLVEAFFRWQADPHLESLCMNLEGRTGADIKLICIHRLPREGVRALVQAYPEQLSMDRQGDARTRFVRHRDVDVSLELSAVETAQAQAVQG